MPIADKLKPLADQILAVLVTARETAETAAKDPNAITPVAWSNNPHTIGTMSTKDIMAAIGLTDLAKSRAALKALVAEGAVYRLGRTRSTSYKAVLPGDDALAASNADDAGMDLSGIVLLTPSENAEPPAVLVLGGVDAMVNDGANAAEVAAV
mgnify:CR=1 FL=1